MLPRPSSSSYSSSTSSSVRPAHEALRRRALHSPRSLPLPKLLLLLLLLPVAVAVTGSAASLVASHNYHMLKPGRYWYDYDRKEWRLDSLPYYFYYDGNPSSKFFMTSMGGTRSSVARLDRQAEEDVGAEKTDSSRKRKRSSNFSAGEPVIGVYQQVLLWTERDPSTGRVRVPYIITGHFASHELAQVQRAMQRISSMTCVDFVQLGQRPALNQLRSYVTIKNMPNRGCMSTIGRRRSSESEINLETRARCTNYKTVLHELMHTLGLRHEHSRPDAEKYVRVHLQNINPQVSTSWFLPLRNEPLESVSMGVPYDYLSIMHYGARDFARQPGALTIETLDPMYQNKIGSATDGSFGDFYKICKMYSCSTCMLKPMHETEAQLRYSNTPNTNPTSGGTAAAFPQPTNALAQPVVAPQSSALPYKGGWRTTWKPRRWIFRRF